MADKGDIMVDKDFGVEIKACIADIAFITSKFVGGDPLLTQTLVIQGVNRQLKTVQGNRGNEIKLDEATAKLMFVSVLRHCANVLEANDGSAQ